MNEMPKWNDLFIPALNFYGDGKAHVNREAKVKIADSLNLSDALRSEVTNKHKENKIEGRVGWALSALKVAGLLEQYERGSFIITLEGKKLLENLPPVLDEQYLIDNYPSYKFNIEKNRENYKNKLLNTNMILKNEKIEDYTPSERIDNAVREIENNLSNELINILFRVDPFRFEEIVADLLDKMGYGDLVVTQKSKDGGIDAIVNEDKFGLDKILVQAKRYASDNVVNEKPIREFIGTLGANKVQKGIFITTSKFSDKAIETIKNCDKKIVMITGEELTKLMIEYNIGTTITKTYDIKTLDTDYFDN